MLINSILQEFLSGPIAFAASIATIVTFLVGCVFALLSHFSRFSIGAWKVSLSAPQFRALAALFWATSVPLFIGTITGLVFTLNWIAGTFAVPVAIFAAAIGTALVGGNLTKDWVLEVSSVRRKSGETDEWFIGLTSLAVFTKKCASGITWLSVISIAAGIASPWLSKLAALDRGYPDAGYSGLVGPLSAMAFVGGVALLRNAIEETASMVFTAQAGIRWADAVPAVSNFSDPTRNPLARPPTTTAPRRRRKATQNPLQDKTEKKA